MKKASGSKKEIKKEATTSRSRKNKPPKQIIKQEVVESDSDEIDSDYAEFLRTYDTEKESSDSEKEYIILLDSPSSTGLSGTEESKKEESEAKSDVESK
ncbi:hypothetical protein QL285_038622 [Trifolium repens]|nr:hypothetical protein QL285_038622 [Trifolium repens]